MKKGDQVKLTSIPSHWSDKPVKLSTKHKVGIRSPKIGTIGKIIGVQEGTGSLLIKFKGRSWPSVCETTHVEKQ